jgi:hypothetical protein
MYIVNRATIYAYQTFTASAGQTAVMQTIDASDYGVPGNAVAVELLLGCRSWGDGGYIAAFDGVDQGVDRIAIYPTALMRNQWGIARGRVELDASQFLLRIRPDSSPIEVIAVIKGYYTDDAP